MKNIAVIIPFFQTEGGLLRASVQSIMEQKLTARATIAIYIVDDGSPVKPADELADLELPNHITITIFSQTNAGQSAARNAALDAIPLQTKFVAFLDFDDVWFPSHLDDALTTLGEDGQFYFCDNYEDGAETSFERSVYFNQETSREDWEGIDACGRAFKFKPGKAFETFIGEYISHTSTVVCRRSQFNNLRFNTDLRVSGEDYFAWLSIARNSNSVTFSLNVNGRRGRGISIYRDAYSWESPKAVHRLLGDLFFWKKVRSCFHLAQRERGIVSQHIRLKRMGISYLIVRNAYRHPVENAKAMINFLKMDFRGFALSPYLLANAVLLAVKGNLDFRLKLNAVTGAGRTSSVRTEPKKQ